ncbi:MAG: hypothetical protein FJ119_05035 [Deltaproteobacteria bacterium]|nr:hypothetical protein [Deltaproteobacteria bacterium]
MISPEARKGVFRTIGVQQKIKNQGGSTMRKLTGGLFFWVVVLCAFTAQAAEPVDVSGVSSEPMAMTIVICSSNSDCATGAECVSAKVCVDDITSMPTSASCTTDDDCDVGSSCQETSICVDDGGCFSDADCAGNPDGEICNLSTGQCVECLTDDNCTEGSFCERGMCVLFEDCDLRIRPTRVRISGRKNAFVVSMLRINGNENFAPRGTRNACTIDSDCAAGERCAGGKCEIVINFDMSFVGDPNFTPSFPPGPDDAKKMINVINPGGTEVRRRLLKIRMRAGTELEPGPVPLRIGKCLGEFELQ